jgi:hypothetical protein
MWSNFIVTLVGIGSVAYLMKSDVRHGGAMLRRNMKTIRSWLEEESTAVKPGCASALRSCRSALIPHRPTRRLNEGTKQEKPPSE